MATSTKSNGVVEHALELLAPLGHARSRRMFGGHGIYIDDVFVAIVADDRLYFKTDTQTRAAFEAAGCEPFTFDTKHGEKEVTSYWSAPADALESGDEMRPWARRALEAALRARAGKSAPKAKPTPNAKHAPVKRAAAKRATAKTSTASAAGRATKRAVTKKR